MKVQELRVGNLINHKERGQITVRSLEADFPEFTEGEMAINGFPESELNPIPLTEEWLLKFGFGFEKHPVYHFVSPDGRWYTYFVNRGYNPPGSEEFAFDKMTGGGEITLAFIKHVHQLQNLYFALTGEELTIK